MSEFALQRIREAKEKRLTRLDLNRCGLTALPNELFELTWLKQLDLSNSIMLNTHKKQLENHPSLENNIIALPDELSALQSLEWLNLAINPGIKQLNKIKYLKNLKWLDCSFNKINNIDFLEKSTNLTYLNLSNNKITTITPLRNSSEITRL